MEQNHVPRISSCIGGLDELLEGGFPRGRSILITGPPGVGKTIFALQFIYQGFVSKDERGVYLSLDERLQGLSETCSRFGWNIEALLAKGGITIVELLPSNFVDIRTVLKEKILSVGATRVVIDPISTIMLQIERAYHARREVIKTLEDLRDAGCTAVVTSETLPTPPFQPEQYLSDGVILLNYLSKGGNALQVSKMRLTKIDRLFHPYWIRADGLSVNPNVIESDSVAGV